MTKLRKKKTGEIGELDTHLCDEIRVYLENKDGFYNTYRTLAELNEEWEDVGTFWFLNGCGDVCEDEDDKHKEEVLENTKQIGNYFNTKEEAEKVVEKLKAWKRLKDKGFRFECYDDYHIDYELTGKCAWTDETKADLDLLFGGGN